MRVLDHDAVKLKLISGMIENLNEEECAGRIIHLNPENRKMTGTNRLLDNLRMKIQLFDFPLRVRSNFAVDIHCIFRQHY